MNNKEKIKALEDIANKLRIHSLKMTTKAGSGHPSTCLSSAEIISVLFFDEMRYDVSDSDNPNNDRFVLSKGHGAPVLYAAWAEAGLIPTEKLYTLREIDSELEGHPTPRAEWIDAATGSLGQGLSIGLGMALNSKYIDTNLDYRIYVLLGDGETAEGAVWEAVELAPYYSLDNFVAILDVNRLGQSQATMYGHDIDSYYKRFSAFGWHAIKIDGHSVEELLDAFEEARTIKDKPTVIVAKTIKGKGVSILEDKNGWHGKPLDEDELEEALSEIEEPSLDYDIEIKSPSDLKPTVPSFGEMEPPDYEIGEEQATRDGYGNGLKKLGKANSTVVSLDGDTKNSTRSEKFMEEYPDRFFEMFIAEQNMVGAAVGLSTHNKIPFVSTFGAFMTRAFDLIRMGAITRANVKFTGSHSGISIGEDGPSQMALEDLAMMRAIPGSVVLYPADAVAAERLVKEASEYEGIVYLRTSRPKVPVIYPNNEIFPIGGSKVLKLSNDDKVTVVSAGVIVHQALKAYQMLKEEDISIRVIDAYSVKPVDVETLRKAASDTNNKLIVVEEHYYDGGLGDAIASALATDKIEVHKMAVEDVPRSGEPEELMDKYGISANCIVEKVKDLV